MCLWEFLLVTIGTCVFCADGIMITNNSNNYYVFLNVFMFRIMSLTLRNINPQKEIFHHYDFPFYTTSKYRDPKLDTYRRITPLPAFFMFIHTSRSLWLHSTYQIYNNYLICELIKINIFTTIWLKYSGACNNAAISSDIIKKAHLTYVLHCRIQDPASTGCGSWVWSLPKRQGVQRPALGLLAGSMSRAPVGVQGAKPPGKYEI